MLVEPGLVVGEAVGVDFDLEVVLLIRKGVVVLQTFFVLVDEFLNLFLGDMHYHHVDGVVVAYHFGHVSGVGGSRMNLLRFLAEFFAEKDFGEEGLARICREVSSNRIHDCGHAFGEIQAVSSRSSFCLFFSNSMPVPKVRRMESVVPRKA